MSSENLTTIANSEEGRRGAVSQGMWVASGRWKRQGNRFSSRASRRHVALPTP